MPARRRWLLPGLLALLVVAGGAAAYLAWFRPKPAPPPPDLIGAYAANVRGVGRMDRFEYPQAQAEFEEAVRLAPDWLPARINLGIALLNQQDPTDKSQAEPVRRAEQLFKELLAKDPDNRYAHYCLGMIAYYFGRTAEAYPHFAAVNRLDPDDAHTWLRLGQTHPDGPQSPAARDCFEKALQLNPNLNEARYRLFQAVQATDPERAEKLIQEHSRLREADWEALSGVKYGEMGKYADVIGRDPSVAGKPPVGPIPMFEPAPGFKVTLAPGAKWATTADLDPLRKAARERFGGAVVLFDYNRDGRPDVFLPSAVVENGKVRDLLLRNDGTFTDVTAAAGLATPRPSLGAAAADYDNDGHPDLVVTGAGEQHLFRNKGDGTFEDASAAAGLDKVAGVCLGCVWIDLDQDSDLDLILCRYADSPEGAANFAADAPRGGGLVVFENVGEARPVPPGGQFLPLTTKFKPEDRLPSAAGPCPAVSVVASDFDGDGDIDLLVLPDRGEPLLVENDRIMRFHRTTPAWAAGQAHRWNGGLVFSATHADRSDLLPIRVDGPPAFLAAKGDRDHGPGSTNSPPLRQAVAVDLDLDGWPDVVGLGTDGAGVFLHNQGDGRLARKAEVFGTEADRVANLRAVVCADLDGDCNLDLLLWSDAGLAARRSAGNGHKALLVDPTGKRDANVVPAQRTNADGIGCRLIAQTGTHWTAAERTTTSAGLGQSLLPTALGMGPATQADVLRIRWPDGALQAEFGVNICAVARIVEQNRKTTSCPVLLTWDGKKYVFVADFLGAGSMGELNPDGSTRPPRPEESVKIEPGQLAVKDGHYLLKIAEPMDEVLYLDHLRLDVIDHPADVTVFPDERFATSDPQPTQALLGFRTRHLPNRATDHSGRDVTAAVRDRDRRAADTFAVRPWLGYAEDHSLTLDFGDVPATPGRRWFLVLAGWTEYPYPESIYAATRAGVPLRFPILERQAADGAWEPLGDLGFPAGLPRVMTRELPGLAPGPLRLRIRTNIQVYWDQAFVAPAEAVERVTRLDVARADLTYRGLLQEITPGGRPPIAYDPDRTEAVPGARWKGRLTRFGDVAELLRAADDRFVVCGPGDEVTVWFDAARLPAMPAGWVRSFVLRTAGYSKDSAVTTVTGGAVSPLPFRAMANYPDFGPAKPPTTDADHWHTRPAGGQGR